MSHHRPVPLPGSASIVYQMKTLLVALLLVLTTLHDGVHAKPITYWSNDDSLRNLICRSATTFANCNTCVQNLGTAPNFFIGDSALQQTFMDGLANCVAQQLPSSHLKCANPLITASSSVTTSNGSTVRTGTTTSNGFFSFIRSIVSAFNVLELKWVRMMQAQNCIKLANIGLS